MKTLADLLGERLLAEEPLARYTAARLGGPAQWLYVARETPEQLAEVVMTAWQQGIPVRVLGAGANVLVADSGVRGLVIVNRMSDITFGDWHGGRNISVASGTSLTVLAHKCQSHGLAGMEWAVSVPGTLGGAVVNNAGAHGGDMAQVVRDVVLVDADKGPQMLTATDLAYEYRSSSLKHRADRRYLVLLATLALPPDDPALIQQRMAHFTDYRKQTQPPGASLGSIFKNPDGDYAGRLIESCNLKGLRTGGAMVSPIHANFFINTGQASARDYHQLIEHVREVVQNQTGVTLETEIEMIGF